MLYVLIILIAMIAVIAKTVSVALKTKAISVTYAIVAPCFVNAYVLVVLGVVTLVLRKCVPYKAFNFRKKIYTVKKGELKFYDKLKIKRWKSKVPEAGWTGGFPKRNLTSTELKYLEKFLYETCFAEVVHVMTAILGFTCLFFFPVKDFYFVLPMLIFNFLLHMPFCIIQRYNRYRLHRVYLFKSRNVIEETSSDESVNQLNAN